MRLAFSLSLLIAAGGCNLLSLAVPCENDNNCPDDTACVEGACAEVVPDDPRDGGRLPDDDGGDEPLVDGGPEPDEDAGPGEVDGGPGVLDGGPDEQDAGYDAGPQDPGLPEGCVELLQPAPDAGPDAGQGLTTYVGNVTVQTDADLAVLDGVNRIEGGLFLFVGEISAISLPDLLEVTGAVEVDDAAVDGGPGLIAPDLGCLQRVGGRVRVYGGAWPDPAFPALTYVGGDVFLRESVASASFPRLRSAYDLDIGGTALVDLSGFPLLGELRNDLYVQGNPELTTLAGMPVPDVGGRLYVRNNDVLGDLGPLTGVSSVTGRLNIENNPALPACQAELWRDRVAKTSWRGHALEVERSDDTATCFNEDPSPCPPSGVVTACDGTEQPLLVLADGTIGNDRTCVGSLTINAGAVDVCAQSLTRVEGDLIVDAAGLDHLRLPALRRVTGNVRINVDGVQTLDLRRLFQVDGDLQIVASTPHDVEVFLPSLYLVGGSLEVRAMASEVVHFPALDDVDVDFTFADNPGPLGLWAPDLDDVLGSFVITGNSALRNMNGVQGFNGTGGNAVFENNASLLTLEHMIDFNAAGGAVTIANNPVLHTLPPNDLSVSGAATVHDNACLNQEAALAWAQTVSLTGDAYANGGAADCPAP